jgi:hypothetical protein
MFLFSPTLKKTLQMKFAPFHFLIRGQLKLYYLQGCVENVINKVCSLLFAFPRTIVIVNYLQAQEVWMELELFLFYNFRYLHIQYSFETD